MNVSVLSSVSLNVGQTTCLSCLKSTISNNICVCESSLLQQGGFVPEPEDVQRNEACNQVIQIAYGNIYFYWLPAMQVFDNITFSSVLLIRAGHVSQCQWA